MDVFDLKDNQLELRILNSFFLMIITSKRDLDINTFSPLTPLTMFSYTFTKHGVNNILVNTNTVFEDATRWSSSDESFNRGVRIERIFYAYHKYQWVHVFQNVIVNRNLT